VTAPYSKPALRTDARMRTAVPHEPNGCGEPTPKPDNRLKGWAKVPVHAGVA
jgi:hypothetical protein